MTPIPSPPEETTPRQAAHRLYQLCDELERCQMPFDQVEELRALSQRFLDHLAQADVFWERLQNFAARQR